MPLSPYRITPEHFLTLCQNRGLEVNISSNILTLTKRFPPGNPAAYASAESLVSLIYEAPSTRPGSTWGTDGGSVGGMVGLQNGYMTLNKSGVSKRWLAKLSKLSGLTFLPVV